MSFWATMVSIQRDMVKAANFKMAKTQFFSPQYAFYVEVDVLIKNSHAKVIQLMFLPFISFRSTIVTERHFAHLSEVLSLPTVHACFDESMRFFFFSFQSIKLVQYFRISVFLCGMIIGENEKKKYCHLANFCPCTWMKLLLSGLWTWLQRNNKYI